MPIFEYKCVKCGKVSEFLEMAGSAVEKVCRYCGSRELNKQFSTFAPRVREGQSKRCYGCSDHTCPHAEH